MSRYSPGGAELVFWQVALPSFSWTGTGTGQTDITPHPRTLRLWTLELGCRQLCSPEAELCGHFDKDGSLEPGIVNLPTTFQAFDICCSSPHPTPCLPYPTPKAFGLPTPPFAGVYPTHSLPHLSPLPTFGLAGWLVGRDGLETLFAAAWPFPTPYPCHCAWGQVPLATPPPSSPWLGGSFPPTGALPGQDQDRNWKTLPSSPFRSG